MSRSKLMPMHKPLAVKSIAGLFLCITQSLMLAQAQPSDSPSARLQNCRALPESQARLACYDALADQISQQAKPTTGQVATSSSSSAAVATAAAAATTSATASTAGVDTFGLTQKSKNEPELIRSQIQGLFQGWGPNRIIDLANGQAWQVIDGSSAVLYLKSPRVEIRKAAMGTFMLELEGSNETARVKRVR